MNEYFRHLNKIEFAVTLACTGRCIHCQNGDPARGTEHIDARAAVGAVRRVCAEYPVETVMTFGGEPLLFPDTVCAIHCAAAGLGVGKRQVITNGCFSRRQETVRATARALADSGVNDLLLSVDAFHQETLPLEPVLYFAECAVKAGLPVRLCPSWLVSREDQNPYNIRTREVLAAFTPLDLPQSPGNIVFPSGNALKYLREYFDDTITPSTPYDDDSRDIRCISIEPNGNALNGNICQTDILEIMNAYQP